MDTSNIFVSEDATHLVNCCEAIKALIFPFKFELVYVPHLPKILAERVETPFIYLLGIKGQTLFSEIKDTIKDGVCIIELDSNKISLIREINPDEDLPDLPTKHLSHLRKALKDVVKKSKGQTLNDFEI